MATGIAPDMLQRRFDPFETGDPSLARRPGGLGLGLSLVGHWVRAMGARIEVDSGPDRGSTFRLTVPTCAAAVKAFDRRGVRARSRRDAAARPSSRAWP